MRHVPSSTLLSMVVYGTSGLAFVGANLLLARALAPVADATSWLDADRGTKVPVRPLPRFLRSEGRAALPARSIQIVKHPAWLQYRHPARHLPLGAKRFVFAWIALDSDQIV